MKLTRYEKETIINFNEAEATANIYTHNGGLIRKLDAFSRPKAGGRKAGPQLPGRRAKIQNPETLGKGERLANFDGGATRRARGKIKGKNCNARN